MISSLSKFVVRAEKIERKRHLHDHANRGEHDREERLRENEVFEWE